MFRHARVGEETRRRRCEMGNISLRDRDTVTAAERGREFWRGVLLAGGFTAVPRWTLDPVPGIAEHEAKICNEVVAALRRLAGELAVPLSSVLLTAHAKVLGALALIAADPDAEHARQTLLSAEELHFQLHGLAGPRRKLSDCRAHELFEERARVHPAAIAAEHGNRRWTYRELNAHANQLARALLARGLSREGVVAVVTERNLDWIAAVLAIFKAGGAYLPIEPHFPADRIARTLSRAGCRLVLTERGSTTMLDQAIDSLSGVQTLFIDELYEEAHSGGDPGVAVALDQLAYIYFTSGSTGEPKGAMCEQAGMLNHLFAKIEDLEIGEGDVVAQTAPQCFDISLWQLLAALMIGGRTELVEQEIVLDAARFIDRIADARVAVIQVVPSYLDVLVSYLAQHPRELPHLRCVSATG